MLHWDQKAYNIQGQIPQFPTFFGGSDRLQALRTTVLDRPDRPDGPKSGWSCGLDGPMVPDRPKLVGLDGPNCIVSCQP